MNTKKYNWIIYLITVTVITTVAVQFYWNYKNFQENRKRLTNEIQISLDNAIEEYYSSISKDSFFSMIRRGPINLDTNINLDSVNKDIWISSKTRRSDLDKKNISSFIFNTDTIDSEDEASKILDSLIKKKGLRINSFNYSTGNSPTKRSILTRHGNFTISDSLRFIKGFESVVIALRNDSIDFLKLDSIFSKQLKTKGIEASFYFQYSDRDSVMINTKEKGKEDFVLFANAKSTYLRNSQQLKAYHSDPTIEALKKSTTGILLSLLLSLSVIGSLIYLLKTINKQKQLAEIKNDLISNITHEFKTPIATVSTAIEAIENFNVIDDKEKTQRYLSMSSLQLKKLHQMVEKLLETATLDSEKLILKKEEIDIIDLISRIVKKHQLVTEKVIHFTSNIDSIFITVDLFHFENAVSNLIDNAIKYGGENILVNVNSLLNTIEISIEDDGMGIEKNQQEKIFDKFYRVAKGNRHDVKGFGIGLYYTKKIVDKHQGHIILESTFDNTIFKIVLPNE